VLKIGWGGTYLKPTAIFALIISCLGACCLTGCSLAGPKRSAAPTPAPSAEHNSDQVAGSSKAPASNGSEQQSETVAANNQVVDQLHTPVKGSDERQAIMDALRQEFDNRQGSYYTPHRGTIVFVVNRLQVHNGWAWMIGYPHSSDPQDSFGEYGGFVLHIQDGHWNLMRLPPMVNDPNDPENLDYPGRKDIEKIRQKFPTIPVDIFSK
jgi:hypothetical protein